MLKVRKKLSVLSVIFVLVGLLTACGDASAPLSTSTPGAVATTAAVATTVASTSAAEPVTSAAAVLPTVTALSATTAAPAATTAAPAATSAATTEAPATTANPTTAAPATTANPTTAAPATTANPTTAAITGRVTTSAATTSAARAVTLKQLQSFQGATETTNGVVAFSPDNKYLATMTAGSKIQVYTVADGKILRTYQHKYAGIEALFFRDNLLYALGTPAEPNPKTTLSNWDINSDGAATSRGGFQRGGIAASFINNGRELAVLFDIPNLRYEIWNAAATELKKQVNLDNCTYGRFSQDGSNLAAGCEGGVINILNTSSGGVVSKVNAFARSANFKVIYRLAFSPNERLLSYVAASDDGRRNVIHTAEVETGKTGTDYTGHEFPVEALRYSQSNQTLASSGVDKTVRLWNVADKRQLTSVNVPSAARELIFSPNGSYLAAHLTDGKIILWQIS